MTVLDGHPAILVDEINLLEEWLRSVRALSASLFLLKEDHQTLAHLTSEILALLREAE